MMTNAVVGSGDRRKTILIVSTCVIDWGGSEELWAGSIPHFKKAGFRVIVYKKAINRSHPRFAGMEETGVLLRDYRTSMGRPARLIGKVKRLWSRYRDGKENRPPGRIPDQAFGKQLRRYRPDLVIVSQGINFDGLIYGFQCLEEKIPYVLIAQKAVEFYWPDSHHREYMTETYRKAKKCFFVSQHNLQLTEEQFGSRFPNSAITFNPVLARRRVIPYPDDKKILKLACVARLFLMDKGQDMLIRVLAQEKWKHRPVHVSFVGSGDDRKGLESLARLLDVKNISFTGQLPDVEIIWSDHHALVLPSRSEGLPLAVVEAMSVGRMVIVTDAGGTAEVVRDGVTGFIGKATGELLEEAMERAWCNRQNWETMGLAAAAWIAGVIPADPAADFFDAVKQIVND